MRKDTRFIIAHKEGNSLSYPGKRLILVDRETGVNYLFIQSGYGAAMTPLLGPDGRPVVTRYFE